MNASRSKLINGAHIVWTVASRDIIDSIRNKTVLGLIITMCIMLLMPKGLTMMFVQPTIILPILDQSSSDMLDVLGSDAELDVVGLKSMEDMSDLLNNSIHADIALVVPQEFGQAVEVGDPLILQGYSTWANHRNAEEAAEELEGRLARLLEQPVEIQVDSNIIYPPEDMGLMQGISTITATSLIFMMGLTLVPNLMFEEKQTKTLHALLITPASIGQVVLGKVVAGLFYIMVTAALVFLFNWTAVVHWEVALLFVIANGLLGVAVGLVLGSFFERAQDVVGLTMLIIIIFIGALFITILNLELPTSIQAIVPWIPSVGLAKLSSAVYSQGYSLKAIWENLFSTIVLSAVLYALIFWKIKRTDV